MKILLLRLLIKYTKCSVLTNGKKISLEWTWQENSLKWDSLVPDDMRIILVGENTVQIGKNYRKSTIASRMKNQKQQQSSKK